MTRRMIVTVLVLGAAAAVVCSGAGETTIKTSAPHELCCAGCTDGEDTAHRVVCDNLAQG
jgi:hypothetical protein